MSIEIKTLIFTALAALLSEPKVCRIESSQHVCDYLDVTSISRGSTIMLVGDSLAVGLGSHFHSEAKRNGYVPVSHTLSGTATTYWLKRMDQLLKQHSPKLVLVSLGTNDSYGVGQHSPAQMHYQRMVDMVIDSGAMLVWIAPPDIRKEKVVKINEVREMIKEISPLYFPSEKYHIPLIDGIHTTGLGYGFWMKNIWSWLSEQKIVATSEK